VSSGVPFVIEVVVYALSAIEPELSKKINILGTSGFHIKTGLQQ
jgi:hypothetical protein